MNYALPNGTARRTLTAGSEVAGGNDVMTRSVVVNSCGPGPMVALSGSNCTLNAPTADFSGNPLSGCAPMTVNFTDLSLNTPTSWNWTFTGGTPASSTLQNPSVTYNTPGTYSVTLVATNASGSDTRIKPPTSLSTIVALWLPLIPAPVRFVKGNPSRSSMPAPIRPQAGTGHSQEAHPVLRLLRIPSLPTILPVPML